MRKCVLCGKEYEYCPSCPKDARKPLWHKLYHSENCRNIFEALNNYNFKLATKEETKEVLSKCDLTIELNDHYRGEVNEIMTELEEIVVEPEVKAETEDSRLKRAKHQQKNKFEESKYGVVTIE